MIAGGVCGASAQETAVIPQVDVNENRFGSSRLQPLEGQSARVITGSIPQVMDYEGNQISLKGLEDSYAALIIPVMPEIASGVPNSPVAGQGLIIGAGNTIIYEAQGTRNGFGFIQYGYGNSVTGRAYGDGNNALVGQFGHGNRARFDQIGNENSLSIMQGQ